MPENTAVTSELTSQYAAQVTNDLDRNVKEQERVSAEIAALQEQLATLQHDHTVLVNMQQALSVVPAPAEPAAASGAPAVPAPRKKTASGPGKAGRAKKTAAAPGRTKTKKPATSKTSAATAKAAQPTLVEIVRAHLAELSEPRSASEIATTLVQTYPERRIKTTVVRTTLENLVAKGQAQRTKQGNSVFYTTPDAPEQTPKPQAQPAKAD
jgi:cell division septum initiation protein DivIVA